MHRVLRPSRPPHAVLIATVLALNMLAACANTPSKEEQEAAKNTFACQLSGERLVIRFDVGEARLLMPDAERVTLHQIPVASGVRYSNGTLELRGKGMALELIRNDAATQLAACAPYTMPKQ
jgi:membrane-bound inhibitor of C-type lysozyme